MEAIEIAQRLAELNQNEEALRAYKLALQDQSEKTPGALMNAALHILQFGQGDDYQISYTLFYDLYQQGSFRQEILQIMDGAFYEPNVKRQKNRYRQNVKLLEKYPYLFRKDFPDFDRLPIRFYPFDDSSYTPLHVAEGRFGDYVKPRDPVVRHYFFKDLENPILAKDVTSQYELEYLRDSVRKSEDLGRENHIYLHYASWPDFCAWLSVLDMKPVLEEKKVVFLMEDELAQYPINFKERFGIDYGKYPLKPAGLREVCRMIWHTQLSSHNGGDFFNEIFDAHPNLLVLPSIILEETEETIEKVEAALRRANSAQDLPQLLPAWKSRRLVLELYSMKDRTAKDILVALYMDRIQESAPFLDKASRLAPVLFFQPHSIDLQYKLGVSDHSGYAILGSEFYNRLCASPVFRDFKYIKTFTPMRRFTTSYGATLRFMEEQAEETKDGGAPKVVDDQVIIRPLNRSFMIDWQNRLFKDSVLVRFEDGKLNPRATFTALAEFLDIPYTESMTYCSQFGERDPESYKGNARGFDPAPVYRTYDSYSTEDERYFLEYFMRDLYEEYGYSFHYYDGAPMDEKRVNELIERFTKIDSMIRDSWRVWLNWTIKKNEERPEEEKEAVRERFKKNPPVNAKLRTLSNQEIKDYFLWPEADLEALLEDLIQDYHANRRRVAAVLLKGLEFVNKNDQPLHMMPKLQLDLALLEQPLYH